MCVDGGGDAGSRPELAGWGGGELCGREGWRWMGWLSGDMASGMGVWLGKGFVYIMFVRRRVVVFVGRFAGCLPAASEPARRPLLPAAANHRLHLLPLAALQGAGGGGMVQTAQRGRVTGREQHGCVSIHQEGG